MSRREIGLLVVLAGAVLAASAGAATLPTFSTTVFFYITYQPDCTFTVSVNGGITMDSASGTGATIPPGPYQIQIRTPLPDNMWDSADCTAANFSLNGPGVSYSSILGTALGPYSATFNVSFAPSSTYTMLDASQPGDPVSFSTTATGSSSSLLPPPPPPPATPAVGSVETDLVGSGIVPYRGKLEASVSSSGKATLLSGGRPPSSLAAGRYDIVATDDSAARGFVVEKLHGKPLTISGARFEGTRSVQVDLTEGSWVYFSSGEASQREFTVG